MSFDESLHPRDTSGQFAEKTGAAPEVSLDSHESMIDSLIRRKMTTPIALGNLLDGTSQEFVEDIADYHTLSHADGDTFSYAGQLGDEGKLFQKRYAASLEGEEIWVGVGRDIAADGKVTATRGTEVQVDGDGWYNLADTGNVFFARKSYDIGRMESKTAKAARDITA